MATQRGTERRPFPTKHQFFDTFLGNNFETRNPIFQYLPYKYLEYWQGNEVKEKSFEEP